MDSKDIPSMSSDLSSQQIVVNQMNELQKNESVMNVSDKSNEVESHESKTSVTSDESNNTLMAIDLREVDSSGDFRSEPKADIELSFKEKISLLEKQLRESQTLIEEKVSENEAMKSELRELKDKDMELIISHEMSGKHSIEDMFAQIGKMNDKMCDFEVKVIDIKKELNEQKVLIEERIRTIEGLLSQQVMDLSEKLEQVVQREDHKERTKNIRVVKKFFADNSMDRFGDDLTELILSFLWFEDKIRLECVSKQWRRLIFNKQFVLDIPGNYSNGTEDSLKGFLGRMKSSDNVITRRKLLESVLKKCHKITKFDSINADLYIDSQVLSLIGQYCPLLMSLHFKDYNDKYLTFFRNYGHKLEELYIRGKNDKIKHILELCPNLKKVHLGYYNDNGWVVLSEYKLYLPKLEEINSELDISSEEVNKMKILSDKYSQTMKTLKVNLKALTVKELKTCIDYICRFENLTELTLVFHSVKTIEPIDDCLSLIGQKCNKLLELFLSIFRTVSISERFFDVFTHFKAIKRLKIELPENSVLSGTVECFKHCKQLIELDINFDDLTEEFFTGIASHLPKLRFLYVYTNVEYFDCFVDSFLSMKNIEKIEYNSKKYWFFGKLLNEVLLTLNGKRIKRFTDNCGLIYDYDDFK